MTLLCSRQESAKSFRTSCIWPRWSSVWWRNGFGVHDQLHSHQFLQSQRHCISRKHQHWRKTKIERIFVLSGNNGQMRQKSPPIGDCLLHTRSSLVKTKNQIAKSDQKIRRWNVNKHWQSDEFAHLLCFGGGRCWNDGFLAEYSKSLNEFGQRDCMSLFNKWAAFVYFHSVPLSPTIFKWKHFQLNNRLQIFGNQSKAARDSLGFTTARNVKGAKWLLDNNLFSFRCFSKTLCITCFDVSLIVSTRRHKIWQIKQFHLQWQWQLNWCEALHCEWL